MNAKRRTELRCILHDLGELLESLDILKAEEEESLDNMPGSFQDSERGDKMQENIDTLESAYDNINSAIEDIQEVLEV